MVVTLLALALTGQAVEEVWHVKCPQGHTINVRGHRDGQWFRAAFPVAKGVPPATVNFGVDMPRGGLPPEVRGTDKELGKELAGKLIGQRPCPGPGPCPPRPPAPPKPPRLPDPVAPEAPELNLAPLVIAGVFILLAMFLSIVFLVAVVAGRNRQ